MKCPEPYEEFSKALKPKDLFPVGNSKKDNNSLPMLPVACSVLAGSGIKSPSSRS